LIVAPGFIDVHAHIEGGIFEIQRLIIIYMMELLLLSPVIAVVRQMI
jgi:predicted amidohydrolase YtcJ